MKIIRLTENDLARIVRRVISEQPVQPKPVVAPSQSYVQTLVSLGSMGGYPAKDVTMTITPQGKGQHKIRINDSTDLGKIVPGGLYPTLDYRVLIKRMPGTFGKITDSEVNDLNKEMKKRVTKIVLGLPAA
jgi:hypothetical protein